MNLCLIGTTYFNVFDKYFITLENLRGNVEKLVDRYTESTKNLEDSKSISTNIDSPEFLATEDSRLDC